MFFIKGFLFVFLLATISCKRTNQLDGFSRDGEGYYYKLSAIGDGNERPKIGDVVVLEAVMKTQNDSVFWDTKHDAANGLFVSMNAEQIKGSCNSYFLNLVEGDSVSFLVKPAVFFRNYFDTIVPSFCGRDSLVKLEAKIIQIISPAEYKTLKENSKFVEIEDIELDELQDIDCYLLEKYSFVKPDDFGIYTLEKTTTNLEKVEAGKRVKLTLEAFFLDDKPVFSGKQEMEFYYGTPDQVIKGLNIVIGSLKKGETIKIIVPSRLAFGEKGSSNGSIPPYTPLVYNIKIIDIK